ncbi:MAG TPA: hypothetical protein DEF47_02570 [Herpetosiphon sp.]|uniref:Uncharacterized protein n=1 Tax=Herpetosiphon aurantiacus (strain ATCC 23779 / DSM 785 / 114-95) TaxID=316274 RepID=A9B6X8_HERA2|nr:hypothetical protein [Herpetosiphon sp.]ABX05846.1 conserved hypothetical protein [Herpetosiphon aurantiacus DSM 785]HBW48773.1 hypothetical protein [Herpetosiphon sp.]
MLRTIRSLRWFGWYAVSTGLLAALAPNLLLSVFGMPTTTEVWPRVAGMLVGFIGVLHMNVSPIDLRRYAMTTVILRLSVPLIFGWWVITGAGPWQLLFFAGADVVGALATLWGLRVDQQMGNPRQTSAIAH